jgi:hypothetical protein
MGTSRDFSRVCGRVLSAYLLSSFLCLMTTFECMRSTTTEIGTTLDFFSVAAFSLAAVVRLALPNPDGSLAVDKSEGHTIRKPVPIHARAIRGEKH